jgi:hypothetical protein
MQTYEIRRGHFKALEGEGLAGLLKDIFGEVKEEGGRRRVSWGAIAEMTVWTDGKMLYVDTKTDKGVDDETAAATIRAYNAFLEKATGFTSKQRRERLQKRAKEGKL